MLLIFSIKIYWYILWIISVGKFEYIKLWSYNINEPTIIVELVFYNILIYTSIVSLQRLINVDIDLYNCIGVLNDNTL